MLVFFFFFSRAIAKSTRVRTHTHASSVLATMGNHDASSQTGVAGTRDRSRLFSNVGFKHFDNRRQRDWCVVCIVFERLVVYKVTLFTFARRDSTRLVPFREKFSFETRGSVRSLRHFAAACVPRAIYPFEVCEWHTRECAIHTPRTEQS